MANDDADAGCGENGHSLCFGKIPVSKKIEKSEKLCSENPVGIRNKFADLRRERAEQIHHNQDQVSQLPNFAFNEFASWNLEK